MTFNIEYEASKKLDFNYEELIEKVIMEAIDFEACPYESEVNVILTGNDEIQEINKEYRRINAPTDVLSFPMIDFQGPADFSMVEDQYEDCFNPETGELLLGDIIISVDKVYEQADNFGHSVIRELAFLVAHSMLHLMAMIIWKMMRESLWKRNRSRS